MKEEEGMEGHEKGKKKEVSEHGREEKIMKRHGREEKKGIQG